MFWGRHEKRLKQALLLRKFEEEFKLVGRSIYKEVPKWNWTKITNVSISNVNETADGVNYWIDKYIKLLIKLKPI